MKNVNSFKTLAPFILFVLMTLVSHSQKNNWESKDIFEKRCFIENLGQFNEFETQTSGKILYGSSTKGMSIFFTANGIIFKHDEKVKRSRKEIRDIMHARESNYAQGTIVSEEEEKKEKKELEFKLVPVYQEMHWVNSAFNPVITASLKQVTKYLFPDKLTYKTIFASGYGALTLKEIYPNIDVEFYFPNDREGLKYNYIVHAGGDASLINEKWVGVKPLLQTNGDLTVETGQGSIVYKKPVTNSTNHQIETTYFFAGENTIGYSFNGELPAEFIIDPWVLTPVYSSSGGFDVDFDDYGNTYVYGGPYPYYCNKYDNTGTLIWTYDAGSLLGSYYGDIGVDRTTGSVYLTSGFCPGSMAIFKLYNSGTFVTSAMSTPGNNEIWRMGFSSCTNQAVLAGGGTSGTEQLSYLDTNLAGITSVAVIAPASPDIALMTIDNYGHCYILTANRFGGAGANELARCPVPAFTPVDWITPLGTGFQELATPTYAPANGYNGIAMGNKTIFTYNAYTVKKLNSETGAITGTFVKNFFAGTPMTASWGGISSDDCKNVFIGSHDTVYHLDSNLVIQNIYPMPGTVIDVRISNAGVVYVTGQNFAKVFVPTGLANCSSAINPGLTVNNATCYSSGNAFVNPSGGTAPYAITWNTVPAQTGDTAVNLMPGSYTVTISDSSCNGNTLVVPFTIVSGPGGITANINAVNPTCSGATNGSITLDITAGVAPFTYVWDTLGITDSSAAGLGAATYSITVNDSAGCITIMNVTLTNPAPVTATTNAGTVNCNGNATSIVCFPSGGTGPYSVVWNTSVPVLNDTLYNATAGVYSLTVTDSNGCTYNFTDTLYEPPVLTLTIATDSVGCNGTPLGQMVATVGGGTGPYTYLWSNNASNNTNTNAGLNPGIYSLTVTDNNGCTIALQDTVFNLVFPGIGFTGTQPCNSGTNGSITANAAGGSSTATFNYSWNTVPVQTGLTVNNVGAGSYVLTVSANGCTNTFPYVLGEDAIVDTLKIQGVACNGSPVVEMHLPGIASPNYQWQLLGVPIAGEINSTYTSSSANAFNVSSTWFYQGCRYETNTVEVGEYPVASQTLIPNIFSPNGDGYNGTFYAMTFIPGTGPEVISYLFKTYHIEIYNRWGQLMFMSDDPNTGWKGDDLGGTAASAGVYFVLLRYEALCSDVQGEVIYNGTVQLVR